MSSSTPQNVLDALGKLDANDKGKFAGAADFDERILGCDTWTVTNTIAFSVLDV